MAHAPFYPTFYCFPSAINSHKQLEMRFISLDLENIYIGINLAMHMATTISSFFTDIVKITL
jgi:hypothetical protein